MPTFLTPPFQNAAMQTILSEAVHNLIAGHIVHRQTRGVSSAAPRRMVAEMTQEFRIIIFR